MGSLITALQNQNIAAANKETLSDVYAANPQNLGYTDNPFGYDASPAVIQTAYPKYGYNATAPMMPPSYEDYDLTTLFSMLQGMQAPQQGGQPQAFTGPVPTGDPMLDGFPAIPSFRFDDSSLPEPMVLPMPGSPVSQDLIFPMRPPGMDMVLPMPGGLEPMVLPMPGGRTPRTPAGILAAMSEEPLPGSEAVSAQPLPGSYRVPGTEPVVEPEPEAEKKAVAAAAPEMSPGEYVRLNKVDPALLREVQATVPYALSPNITRDEAFALMYAGQE